MSEHKPSVAAIAIVDAWPEMAEGEPFSGAAVVDLTRVIDHALAPERERVRVLRKAAVNGLTWLEGGRQLASAPAQLRTALAAFDKEANSE